jgi:hypothetical protein
MPYMPKKQMYLDCQVPKDQQVLLVQQVQRVQQVQPEHKAWQDRKE